MSDVATTRQAVADAVVAAAASVGLALNMRPRPVRNPRPLDGWVNLGPIRPAAYTTCDVVMTAVVLLSAEEGNAEDRFEQLAVPLVDAVTKGALHPAGVLCEPVAVPVGDPPAPMYALALSMTLEVT